MTWEQALGTRWRWNEAGGGVGVRELFSGFTVSADDFSCKAKGLSAPRRPSPSREVLTVQGGHLTMSTLSLPLFAPLPLSTTKVFVNKAAAFSRALRPQQT